MATADLTSPLSAVRVGAVELTVSDLDRSVAFYQDAIGLRQHRREDPVAVLGAGGEDLLVLHELPGAQRPGYHTGLFHLALLHPDRAELARALARLVTARAPLSGASDHGVSEALYLDDPDGNGIELYADRPREAWPAPEREGERVGMFTAPLDLRELLADVAGEEPARHADTGLVMGHVHLHVSELDAAQAFYLDVVVAA